ncbi:M20/M25/M40 family metallo-hydrolase [Pontiella agarivorans]|uniref:M20/M25/M40 family metallo-hydrolase n=1 Tax=Pontiella agarivorans TaxID=3038953 RepID=A0ABU5MUL8_9BACT|nr:M20/M25/M40 family metallo-hydrolase [Pontiella agarivorans]MDZ8117855.1 M20/M25/M40 family metallo-hydrolase [Pontiella agarivorans]
MIDKERAMEHLLDLLAIEGPTGQETAVVEAITQKLLTAGCKKEWIKTDDAHERLGEGFKIGNLIAKLPGTVNAPRIMFSAHMDTVPLCRGAEPVIQGNRVVAKGNTGLGGDDRSGCAAIVTLCETLLKNDLPHPPITFLFPIAEENGLHGSRMVRFSDLGNPAMGFNLDGQFPNEIVIGAMSAVRWTAEITGISTHAGLEPENGISAGLIASKAMTHIAEQGCFGRIEKDNGSGTANLGTIHGGEANNQVMDRCILTGECRSHSPDFLEQIIQVYKDSFEQAASRVTNEQGKCGKIKWSVISDYNAFKLKKSEPCVQIASKAVKLTGKEPRPLVMDAGLDANNFNEKGLPTVTLGTGAHKFHQVEEYVEINEYLFSCDVLLQIATLSAKP